MVKDFAGMKNVEQVRKLLKVLGKDFTYCGNANWRKGGIIGLAATAMGLGRVGCIWVKNLLE